jgi:hypothetical protein
VFPIRTKKILRALRGLIFFRNRPLQASLFELRPDRSLKAPRTQSNYTGLGAWLRHQQTNKCSPKYICDCRCFSINCPQGIGTLFESKDQPALYRLVYPIRTKKPSRSLRLRGLIYMRLSPPQPPLPAGHELFVRIVPPAGALSAGLPDSYKKKPSRPRGSIF